MSQHRPLLIALRAALTVTGAVILGVLIASSAAADGQQVTPSTTTSAPQGEYLFRTYCAACHGTTARGDGPLAETMRRRPPNLTEIARRHNGQYPAALVFQVIDGRRKVAGHGGPDMPVWGDAFLRSQEVRGEAAVAVRIQALVDYLERIQVRDTP